MTATCFPGKLICMCFNHAHWKQKNIKPTSGLNYPLCAIFGGMLMGCYIYIYIYYVLLNETSLSKKLESKNNRNIHQKSCSMVGSVQLLRLGAIYANVSPIPNKGWSTVKDSLLPRGKVWSLDFLSMASSSNQWQVDHIVPITRTIFKMTSKLDEIHPKKVVFQKCPRKTLKTSWRHTWSQVWGAFISGL